ncbi:MAG: PD40 domain-containing protein [Alphaproteobacteria bacterium]|nr:MAG: PD40 domain-containing protein [Alphaproteobacteria bacterium]
MSLSQYYRYPVGYKDKIYMISHETLWWWSKSHGLNRWIMLKHHASNLSISPDGKYLAFTGAEQSDSDVYIINLETHEPIRKTFYNRSTYLVGWYDNDHLVYSTNYELPFKKQFQLFKLNIHNNQHTKIPCGYANWISWTDKNEPVIQRYGYGYNNWREYKGGTVGDLWIKQSHNFEKIEFANSNALKPVCINDKVYFLSDLNGIGNIFEYDLKTKTWNQKTYHEDFYVKDIAKYNNDELLYSKGGEIYCFNTKNNTDTNLNIAGPCYNFEQSNFTLDDNYSFMTSFSINNEGSEVGVCIRGKSYVSKLWNKGYEIKNDKIRSRINLWNHKNEIVSIIDDLSDSIIKIGDIDQFTIKNIGRIDQYRISNDTLVTINNRNEMWIIDLDKKVGEKIIDTGNTFSGFDISSDAKWVVYSRSIYTRGPGELSSIFLYSLDNKTTVQVTPPYFYDVSPTFDPNGKYIYFLSFRDLSTEFDPFKFSLYFKAGMKPFAIGLQENTKDPFVDFIEIEDETCKLDDDCSEDCKKNDCKNQKELEIKDKAIQIDLSNIQQRIFESKLKPGEYTKLTALDDRLILLSQNKTLEAFTFQSDKLENIASNVVAYRLSENRKWQVILTEEKLRVGAAGTKFDDNDTSYKKGSWVSLDHISVDVNPIQEWKQILEEVWWLTKEHFWESNLNKIKWDDIKQKYLYLVDKIKSRQELNLILSDMIGELKTSHAYVLEPGDIIEPEHKKCGYLGAKFEKVDSGFQIEKIYFTHNVRSPLHMNAQVGDVITHVNGKSMKQEQTIDTNLHLDTNVITLNNDKNIYIKPLSNWNYLAYQRWIESNVEKIANKSQDIGYVHIPNMVQTGFHEFYRRYIFEHMKKGLIIDVRHNSGGFLSALILDRLQRKRAAYSVPRHGLKEPYPNESPTGPMVLLCNEYTGSDGDIFTKMFKELSLGTVVGKRTWGGVVGIMPRYYLIDGGLTSQPEFGIMMKNGGLEMENQGVDPDIEVDITPEDLEHDNDTQLNKAIEVVLEKINGSVF